MQSAREMQARACAVSAVASCTHRCPGGDAQPATTMAFESVPGGCKPCLHSGESIVIMHRILYLGRCLHVAFTMQH